MKPSLLDSKTLDLSIIIISYNTKQLTLQCIKSILNSIKKLDYEVIIVDNASTDGTLSLVEGLKLKNKNYKIKLKIIENKKNLGFAKANNQGIRIAKGNYILLLNSDTKVKSGAIEGLIEFARITPDAGAVGAKLLNPDDTLQPSVFRLPTIWRAIKQYWLGEEGLLDKYAPEGDKPTEVESLVMASFLITPKALKKIGLLNEKYFMYFEDLDYCRSILRAGLKIFYLPDSEIIHYHGASGEKSKKNEIQFMRLKKSSQIYNGLLNYSLITFIIWSSQKYTKLFNRGK